MNHSTTTTSIRLSPLLRETLESVSTKLNRGKSWIINEALRCYFSSFQQDTLKKEARRQSQLASKASISSDDSLWENNADHREWK